MLIVLLLSFLLRFLDSANDCSLQQRGIMFVMNSLVLAAIESEGGGIAMFMTDVRSHLKDIGIKGGSAYRTGLNGGFRNLDGMTQRCRRRAELEGTGEGEEEVRMRVSNCLNGERPSRGCRPGYRADRWMLPRKPPGRILTI